MIFRRIFQLPLNITLITYKIFIIWTYFSDVWNLGIAAYYVTAHALQRSFITLLWLFITVFLILIILFGVLYLHHDFFLLIAVFLHFIAHAILKKLCIFSHVILKLKTIKFSYISCYALSRHWYSNCRFVYEKIL